MRILIESLKRLYINRKIQIDKLDYMLELETITQEEYNYVIQEG